MNQPVRVAFFYVAVVVSSYYGGLRVGLFAILLSAVVAAYFLFPPVYTFNIGFNGYLQLSIFMGVALTITLLMEKNKRAEGNLQEAELRFRQLAENIDQVFWVFDVQQAKLVYISPAFGTIWGTPPNGLYERPQKFLEFVHPEDRALVDGALQLPATGERTEKVYRIVRPDGATRWIHDCGFPVGDERGKIVRVVGIAEDITERMAADKALREQTEAANRERAKAEANEQYYRFLAESIPQIVWTARPDGFIDYYNQRWHDYTGMTLEQTQGWSWQPVLHPDDLENCIRRWAHAIETGETYEIEYRFKRATDGQYRWHLGRALPLRDRDGEIIKWLGTCTDIDDRKRMEESQRFLAEASQVLVSSFDYQTMLAAFAQFVVPGLADWCMIDMTTDERAIRRLAIAHQDPAKLETAWTLARLYPQEMSDPEGVAKVIRTGQPELYADISDELLAFMTRDGEHLKLLRELKPRSAMVVPLIAHHRVLGAVTLIAAESGRQFNSADLDFAGDLAHRAALAVDNARLYREAQEVNRLKDEFLATLSHELRTPLTAVLGWTRLLSTGQLDAATRQRALETIERNAHSQVQLIDDILDVSRIIRGKLRLNVRAVAPAAIIEAAVEAVRPAVEAKGIRLQVVLDGGAGIVSGDPDRLQQVVWNLLSNAIKFTPKDGRVQVLLTRVNSHLEIIVSDTGPGIDADFLPFVFDRFRQADPSSTRMHGGLGLGLAIVRHLVELHGGTVSVETRGAEPGATFKVMLPLMAVHQTAFAEQPTAGATDAAVHPTAGGRTTLDCPPQLHGLRVLVVEDEPDARELLVAVLTQCEAEVLAVSNVAEALLKLEEWRPDVLISDIEMPGEDGYALIRRIRALPAERGGRIPAAALTAYARAEDRMRALLAGFQIHLPKPVEPTELAAVVASLAGRQK